MAKINLKSYRLLVKYLKNYKREIYFLGFLGIVFALVDGFVPYIVGRLFDAIISPEIVTLPFVLWSVPLFIVILVIWFVVQLFSNTLTWYSQDRNNRLGARIYTDFTAKSFGRLLELPLSFLKNNKLGDIGDRISRTADSLNVIISDVAIDVGPDLLRIIVVFAIVFLINPLLSSFLLLGVLAYIGIMIYVIPKSIKNQRLQQKAWNKAYGDAFDAIHNASTVKQASAENYEKKKLNLNFNSTVYKYWLGQFRIWQGLFYSQRIIITIVQLLIFSFSIYLIQQGKMTIGELVMFNGYSAVLFGPFVRLGNIWKYLENGLVSLERTDKALSTPTEDYHPKNAPEIKELRGVIELKNVFFTYPEKKGYVLKNINIKVNQGHVVALVGESGVGKSTLIDLISGYYFPQKGKVLIDGIDTKKMDLEVLRKYIAVVPQEVILFNDSIKKNIAYGNFSATEAEIQNALKESYSAEFIETFPKKLKQVVGERGVKLSVGQKQRVAIARAILRDPQILILDEPTSALDAKSEKFIQASLESLMKGRTTFIIAHRLSTVRKADQILVFKKGRIVEQGTHKQLIKIPNGVYRELYEFQIGLTE